MSDLSDREKKVVTGVAAVGSIWAFLFFIVPVMLFLIMVGVSCAAGLGS
jgi:hypothetical protein